LAVPDPKARITPIKRMARFLRTRGLRVLGRRVASLRLSSLFTAPTLGRESLPEMVRRSQLISHLVAEVSHDMEVPPNANIAGPGLREDQCLPATSCHAVLGQEPAPRLRTHSVGGADKGCRGTAHAGVPLHHPSPSASYLPDIP